jgi:hypothetical protein
MYVASNQRTVIKRTPCPLSINHRNAGYAGCSDMHPDKCVGPSRPVEVRIIAASEVYVMCSKCSKTYG